MEVDGGVVVELVGSEVNWLDETRYFKNYSEQKLMSPLISFISLYNCRN